jgi:hypothetical protein
LLIVVVVTVVGVGILSGTDDRRDGESPDDIEITATPSGAGLEHRGGNRFDASRVSVVVRAGETEQRFVLADDFRTNDSDGTTVGPGQRWTQNTTESYSGEIEVLVVDSERGAVLEQTTAVVGRRTSISAAWSSPDRR